MTLKIDRVQLEILVKQDSARNKMIELEDKMKSVRQQMKITKKQFTENSEEYKKQEAELKKLKQQYDDLFDEIGIGKLSLVELANRQRELNAILRNMDPSLPEWKQYNEQLRQVNARIAELRGRSRDTGLSLSKLTDGFNKYTGIAAAGIASLTGVALTARKCVDEFAKMEEAKSQVRKYTGMTTEEVNQLNEEFKRMDTRTARDKLNALAGDAGRLGITGKKDIMEFVEAANIINVALGEDLGEDAVKNIGKLAQMFGEDENMGLRGAMLSTASAVNEVAQNSSAAESFLVDFTARVAGVGQQAGLSQADIIGFAAAMDENMLRSETSSTAYQKIIMKMFTDTDKFAKAAGLDLQSFAELVRTDANEAVLQFAQALSQKGGLADLAPIFGDLQTEGAGVSSVLSVMASKADEIRQRQQLANDAYREGTSVINEYGVQNETVQAQLDKAKKRFQDMRIELGEKLLPYMQHMISTGRMTVNMLATTVGFVAKYSGELASLAVGIATYTVAVKAATVAMKAYEAATSLAKMSMLALDKVTKANIFGLLLSGLAAVVSYFAWFRNEADETGKSLDTLSAKAEETKNKLDRVAGVEDKLSNQDLLSDAQKKRLRSDVESAIADLDDVITASQIATRQWYQQQREQLMKEAGDNEILQKSYLNGLEHDLQERAKVIQGYIEQKAKLEAELAAMPVTGSTGFTANDKPIEDTTKQELQAKQMQMAIAYEQQKNTIKQAYIDQQLTEEEYQRQLYDAETAYLMARKALLESYGEDASTIQGQILDRMISESNRLYQEAEKAKAEADKTTAAENKGRLDDQSSQGSERVSAIKQAYVNGDIDSHQAMLDAIKEAERQNLVERIGLMEEMGMDSSKLQGELLDMEVEAQREAEEEKTRIAEEKAKEREAITSSSLNTIGSLAGSMSQLYQAMQDAELSKVQRKYDKQIAAAKKAGKDTTKLEEQKEQEQAEIKKKYANKVFAMQVLQITSSTAVAAMEAYKAMAGIPVVGPALGAAAAAAAVIAGAAQIAVAKQQRDEAKGLYSGGYSEGYTATGNPREEAGVIPVHKNEFVANHEAVANPAVRQFLDVFDVAQRNGSIRMLDTTKILEMAAIRGRYAGGYSSSSDAASPGAASSSSVSAWSAIPEDLRLQLVTLMSENNELLRAIRDKELVVDPRKIRDSIDRINTLEKNVSRG